MRKTMAAGQFKAQVMRTQLTPIEKKKRPYFGWMKGTIQIKGDIIKPIDEKWDACC